MTVRGVFVGAKQRRSLQGGDVLFEAGDPGDQMFGVVSGRIELRDGDRVVGHVDPDGTFGELAIIDQAPRRLTAVATEPTELAVIDQRTFLFLVHETPTFALEVMRSIADWLRVAGVPT